MDTSDVSVVIPAHNSAGTLGLCLEALAKSTVQPLECVVVDDCSSDDVRTVAQRHGARLIVLSKRVGPAGARNAGVRHARGGLILFLDADVCVHPDTIARVVKHFRDDRSLDAVIGAYDDSPAAASALSQYRNLLHSFTHRVGRREASTFWAGCGAIRKVAFLGCGGLDESYDRPSIEDIEFGVRLKAAGGRILLDHEIQVTHLKCWTFASMLKTDIFDRGVPWTRLLLRAGSMPDDLNVRWGQRLSVLFAFLLVVALGSGSAIAALACALACGLLNLPFYMFLAARRGPLFLCYAVPLDFLFHLYSGVSFVLGAGAHFFSVMKTSLVAVTREETS